MPLSFYFFIWVRIPGPNFFVRFLVLCILDDVQCTGIFET